MPIDFTPITESEKEKSTIDFTPLNISEDEGVETEFVPTVPKDVIEKISKQTGVSSDILEQRALYQGADIEGQKLGAEERAKQLVGFMGESVFAGIPKWVAKKLEDDPKMREAFDLLDEDINNRTSLGRNIAEFGVGAISGIGGVAAAGKLAQAVGAGAKAIKGAQLAGGTVEGVAVGTAATKEGEEVAGAITGGALGLGLGVGVNVASKAISAARKSLGRKAGKEMARAIKKTDVNIDEAIQPILKEEQDIANFIEKEIIKSDSADSLTGVNSFASKESSAKLINRITDKEATSFASTNKDTILADVIDLQDIKQVKEYLAFSKMQEDAIKFAKYLKPSAKPKDATQASEIISSFSREGKEFLTKQYKNFKEVEATYKFFNTRIGQELKEDLARNHSVFNNKVTRFIMDGREAARAMDDILGVSYQPALDKASRAQNLYTQKIFNTNIDIKEGVKFLKNYKISNEQLYEALDEGIVEGLDSKQLKAVQYWKDMTEKFRGEAEEGGLVIAKRDNYIPKYPKSTVDVIGELDSRVTAIEKNTGVNILKEKPTDAVKSTPEYADIVRAVNWLQPEKVVPEDVARALRLNMDPVVVSNKVNSVAISSLKRKGEIPDFLLEKDPQRLFQGWATNTFRHLAFRDTVADLTKIRNQAVAAGKKDIATYVNNHIADILGVRAGTPSSWTRKQKLNFQVAMDKKIRQTDTAWKKGAYQVLKESPDMVGALTQNVYTAFLGLSPRAVLTNLTQPWTMTGPELGLAYGTPKVMKAYGTLLKNITQGKKIRLSKEVATKLGKKPGEIITTRNPRLVLENQGLIQQRWNTELVSELSDSIKKSAPYKLSKDGLEKANNFAMWAYEASETVNRSIAKSVSDDVVKDIMAGNAQAAKFVNNLPDAYKRKVTSLMEGGKREELMEAVEDYIIGKTIFNYNRVSMSEFGRYIGPVFSVFTKWPTSIAGDVLNVLNERGKVKGLTELGRKYMIPLALLRFGDLALEEEVSESPALKKVLGASGLSGMGPIGSIESVIKGDVLRPPVIQIPMEIIGGAITGDPKQLWRTINEGVRAFALGSVYMRFLAEDLPVYLGEDKPEGTFINNVMEAVGAEGPDESIQDLPTIKELITD